MTMPDELPTTDHKPTKVQTRRSISVKGTTYRRLKEHCDAQGRAVSNWLEEAIAQKMQRERDLGARGWR